ncbi:phosphotransferase family protein [Frondihabitans sp. PAMC 28766]|uniref:phosphotransferase family protein n=1 Tax=Frondihabitans sp. PAMC 28766 TaxID=1795630 RepID=UPI0019522E47|nr:phosphotransferase family protein [Frondihabitans sp. PAMC 28766]
MTDFLQQKGLVDGSITTKAIGDGHSNLTYLVSDGERRMIVRRPPPPPLPKGAHDVLREALFLGALEGTSVPVPTLLATAQTGEVIDFPFYVMSVVDGPVVTTRTPAPLDTPSRRLEIGESLVDTLAELHSVDWRSRGLSRAGRPEGFNERHFRRMRRLIADADDLLPPEFRRIEAWLAATVPVESGASIVHNDFRLGNVVLAPEGRGRVVGVLDWELTTIGDPLFDLGYFLASVPVAGEPLTPTEELGVALLEEGYPTRQELTDRYEARTGADLTHLPWYTTLALWKLAVLYEYGRRRAATGGGDDYYSDPALVTAFLDAAQRAAEGTA